MFTHNMFTTLQKRYSVENKQSKNIAGWKQNNNNMVKMKPNVYNHNKYKWIKLNNFKKGRDAQTGFKNQLCEWHLYIMVQKDWKLIMRKDLLNKFLARESHFGYIISNKLLFKAK